MLVEIIYEIINTKISAAYSPKLPKYTQKENEKKTLNTKKPSPRQTAGFYGSLNLENDELQIFFTQKKKESRPFFVYISRTLNNKKLLRG